MILTGALDTSTLASPPGESPESCGIQLESTRRTTANPTPNGCAINVGALDDRSGALPLLTLSREGGRFLLGVPRNSFLTLYFLRRGDRLHWSTSLAAMARLADSRTANTAYEGFGLKYQLWPGSETVYAGVQKVSPGQQLVVDATAQDFEALPPPQVETPQVDPDDSAAVQRLIHETLLAAVDQLSDHSGTTGVMLGGFDSALIVALLAELGRPTHAVTLGYANDKYNQAHIETLAQRYDFTHQWVRIEPSLVRDGLSSYGDYFDQPVTQPHYLISGLQLGRALVERGVSTALTGDGCDGLFFGYPTVFRKARLVRTLQRVPRPLKRLLRGLLETSLAEKFVGQPARLLRQMLEVTSRPEHLQNFLTAMAVDNASARRALHRAPLDPGFEEQQLESLFQATVAGKDWVDITYISKNMVGLNRAKLASIWNHSGLDKIYSPYMMPAVAAMAASIPKEYWLSDETPSGKYLLTRMTLEHDLLGEDIVYQKKMSPVASPTDFWLRGELHDEVLSLLSEETSINAEYCRELLRTRSLEEWFKSRVTIDDYASQAMGMLLSYSRMVDM